MNGVHAAQLKQSMGNYLWTWMRGQGPGLWRWTRLLGQSSALHSVSAWCSHSGKRSNSRSNNHPHHSIPPVPGIYPVPGTGLGPLHKLSSWPHPPLLTHKAQPTLASCFILRCQLIGHLLRKDLLWPMYSIKPPLFISTTAPCFFHSQPLLKLIIIHLFGCLLD